MALPPITLSQCPYDSTTYAPTILTACPYHPIIVCPYHAIARIYVTPSSYAPKMLTLFPYVLYFTLPTAAVLAAGHRGRRHVGAM